MTAPTFPTFIFDNNVSRTVADGLKTFGEATTHVLDIWQEDPGDAVLLPEVGKRGLILVTRDLRQRRRPAEVAAYREHRLGVFQLGGKGLGRCDIIRQVIRNWQRMKELAEKTERPFVFRIPANGTRIDSVPI